MRIVVAVRDEIVVLLRRVKLPAADHQRETIANRKRQPRQYLPQYGGWLVARLDHQVRHVAIRGRRSLTEQLDVVEARSQNVAQFVGGEFTHVKWILRMPLFRTERTIRSRQHQSTTWLEDPPDLADQ